MAKSNKTFRSDALRKAKDIQLKDKKIEFSDVEAKFLGLYADKQEKNSDYVYVVLKYYQSKYQCFSHWKEDELSAFSDFIEKLSQRTWKQIYETSGKLGDKSGLGYTPHKNRKKLPKCSKIDAISEDVTFFELRVSQTARVHGFRVKSAFFLVWLDRQHQIHKM